MKPYISVLIPIMRPGGLDVIFSGLENQIFKDFELILIDNLYEYRKDIIAEKAKQYSFKCIHLSPIINKFPKHQLCHCFNSAIVQASGEVILFTSDYRYFMPQALQKHADFHKSHADNFGYSPPTKYINPKTIKSGLPSYNNPIDPHRNINNYDHYIQDLKDHKLDNYMWSIYENEFTTNGPDPSGWSEMDKELGYDPRTNTPPQNEVSPKLFFLQTESIKTKMVLAANGLNEEFDGASGYMDIEFSHRLRNLFNFKFIGDNTNTSYRITGGHTIIQKPRLAKEVNNNSLTLFQKYENGSKDPVNKWNLLITHASNMQCKDL